MSTVVGDCQDCIVSLPTIPQRSMSIQVKALVGNKLIRRSVGDFQGFYPADNVSEQTLSLAPNISFTGPKIAALMIATDQPVTLVLTKDAVVVTLTVNSLFVCDSGYDSFVITNPQAATENANVSAVYTGA